MTARVQVTVTAGPRHEQAGSHEEWTGSQVQVEVEVDGERADVELPTPPESIAAREAWIEHLNVDVTGPVLREATACASILARALAEAVVR